MAKIVPSGPRSQGQSWPAVLGALGSSCREGGLAVQIPILPEKNKPKTFPSAVILPWEQHHDKT